MRAVNDTMTTAPAPGDDIVICAIKILNTSDPLLKAKYTQQVFALWQQGTVPCQRPSPHACIPERPAINPNLKLVAPAYVPKRGKGGSLASRQALVHSLVHIECCAIDLAWDVIARFGSQPEYACLPEEFIGDFVTVAADEARHFSALLDRLHDMEGMDYGDLPVHDGLWESAAATSGSLPARLAIEHCTHEARGLDILPQTISRFRNNGDAATADLLEGVIYPEEVNHCAAGVRWLKHMHETALKDTWNKEHSTNGTTTSNGTMDVPSWVVDARKYETVQEWFQSLVRQYFHGLLKPPFNDEARTKAGFDPSWYMPLSA